MTLIHCSPVAVGTALSGRPPHRSVREELPHTAPISGRDDQSLGRIRVHDVNRRDPPANEAFAKTLPGPTLAPSLTAASQHMEPVARHAVSKCIQAILVSGDGMVVVPSLDYRTKPSAHVRCLMVHPTVQFFLDLLQLRSHPLRHALPP